MIYTYIYVINKTKLSKLRYMSAKECKGAFGLLEQSEIQERFVSLKINCLKTYNL